MIVLQAAEKVATFPHWGTLKVAMIPDWGMIYHISKNIKLWLGPFKGHIQSYFFWFSDLTIITHWATWEQQMESWIKQPIEALFKRKTITCIVIAIISNLLIKLSSIINDFMHNHYKIGKTPKNNIYEWDSFLNLLPVWLHLTS